MRGTGSAEAYYVRPGTEIELWEETDEPESRDQRVMIVSFAGNEPNRVGEGRTINVWEGGHYVTIVSGRYRLSAGTIVMERSNLTNVGDSPNQEMNRIRYYVCVLDNHWSLPVLP